MENQIESYKDALVQEIDQEILEDPKEIVTVVAVEEEIDQQENQEEFFNDNLESYKEALVQDLDQKDIEDSKKPVVVVAKECPKELKTENFSKTEEKKEVNQEVNQEEFFNDDLNMDELMEGGGEEEVEEEKKEITFKGILLILFQITLVFTISVFQFVFSKLEMFWNFGKEKLLSFYKKKEIEKYVNEANETYSRLNLENYLKVLKESLNENFVNIKRQSLKFVPTKITSLFTKNS
jgi:hypothetical protein